MSITRMSRFTLDKATLICGENSRSVSKTFVSACSKILASVSASIRIFRVFKTAPVINTPKCASKIAGIFGAITDTVSPLPIPRLLKAEASLQHRMYVSAQVQRCFP